jgi:hypothetical protein
MGLCNLKNFDGTNPRKLGHIIFLFFPCASAIRRILTVLTLDALRCNWHQGNRCFVGKCPRYSNGSLNELMGLPRIRDADTLIISVFHCNHRTHWNPRTKAPASLLALSQPSSNLLMSNRPALSPTSLLNPRLAIQQLPMPNPRALLPASLLALRQPTVFETSDVEPPTSLLNPRLAI